MRTVCRARTFTVLLLILAVMTAAAAACGSGAAFAQDSPVCQAITAQSTRVAIARVHPPNTGENASTPFGGTFGVPAHMASTNIDAIRHIATLVCHMPAWPPDRSFAASLSDYRYVLTFSNSGRVIAKLTITLVGEGLATVDGLVADKTGMLENDSAVWPALGALAGHPQATGEAFTEQP